MAGQVSILDENFVVNQANGVKRYTAVVQGASDNQCANPSAGGVSGFLGVAQEDKDNGLTASVRMLGTTYVKAKGPIPVGSALAIADANGYVDVVTNVAGAQEVIGFALTASAALDDLLLVNILKSKTSSVAAATTGVVGGVKQAAHQANSVAADVATVVTDFNALLAKLQTAGIMA